MAEETLFPISGAVSYPCQNMPQYKHLLFMTQQQLKKPHEESRVVNCRKRLKNT